MNALQYRKKNIKKWALCWTLTAESFFSIKAGVQE
jgi:hypothetical protein